MKEPLAEMLRGFFLLQKEVYLLFVSIGESFVEVFGKGQRLMHAEVAGERNERKQLGCSVAEPACICCRIVPRRFFAFALRDICVSPFSS